MFARCVERLLDNQWRRLWGGAEMRGHQCEGGVIFNQKKEPEEAVGQNRAHINARLTNQKEDNTNTHLCRFADFLLNKYIFH